MGRYSARNLFRTRSPGRKEGLLKGIRQVDRRGSTPGPWLTRMLARKPRMLVAVARVNTMARIAWPVMTTKQSYPGLPAAD